MEWLIFGLCVMFGAFYALLLECSERWLRVVSRATWLTVVIGVGITLALCGLFTLFTEFTYWRVWACLLYTSLELLRTATPSRCAHLTIGCETERGRRWKTLRY